MRIESCSSAVELAEAIEGRITINDARSADQRVCAGRLGTADAKVQSGTVIFGCNRGDEDQKREYPDRYALTSAWTRLVRLA